MKPTGTGFFHFAVLVFLLVLAGSRPAVSSEQVVSITMPAEVLRQTISDSLPLPIEPQNHYMEGSIVVDSLEKLQINGKSIFLQGVVLGRDIAMKTRIAGQDVKMKLGSVKLPVRCELFLRFDKQQKILFVTPVFPEAEKDASADSADILLPLLHSLGGREYPIALDSIEPFLFRVGDRTIPVKLMPADIQTVKGAMVIKMIPRVYKSP
ncbi:MAG: hypothetical protein C4531_11855 [Desulfurivibrio sp.]|nr:MAG: hypothetical protein C4531_11855 [Desulfurivibrio sp.]